MNWIAINFAAAGSKFGWQVSSYFIQLLAIWVVLGVGLLLPLLFFYQPCQFTTEHIYRPLIVNLLSISQSESSHLPPLAVAFFNFINAHKLRINLLAVVYCYAVVSVKAKDIIFICKRGKTRKPKSGNVPIIQWAAAIKWIGLLTTKGKQRINPLFFYYNHLLFSFWAFEKRMLKIDHPVFRESLINCIH